MDEVLPPEEPPEPLLRFKEAFNFKRFVKECLAPSENELSEIVVSSARLIGQEKDGGILFAWDTKNEGDETVTHVGWFSQSSPTYRTLYKHEEQVNICAASVNFERTLLAFTVKEQRGNDVNYEPFVAEIQPQGRVFTLNIGGQEFRKLQFLYPEVSTPKSRIGRHHQMSRLLVIVPEVYVCLYMFKMQVVRLGAILVQQPEQEVIAENFSWYQFDPQFQWLYYARFESTTSPFHASVSGRNSLLLHCLSFTSSSYQLLLTVSLPLPYNEKVYSSSTTYYHSPFAFTIPVHEMNLQVLRRRDGFWCVCLQHCTGVASFDDSNFEYEDIDTPQGSKIDYSVYIIHNGYVMYGQVPLPIPTNEDMYIHFMLLGCFVAAYIPGFMLHLLNVGPRTDPCHHLAFGPSLTPDFPTQKSGDSNVYSPVLSTAVSTSLLGDYNTTVMECNSELLYECGLTVSSFLQLFKSSQNHDLREDLLHVMIVGFRHHGMALSMIEHICQTPMMLVDHRLFAEFMISSSFANVHFDCKRYLAKQLPLTTTPTFRGRIYKNKDGTKLYLLKITSMPNFIKQLLVQSDQKLVSATPEELLNHNPQGESAFDVLCYTAVTSQPKIARIDIRAIMAEAAVKSTQSSPQEAPPLPPRGKLSRKGSSSLQESMSSPRSSLRNVLTTLTRRSHISRATPHTRSDLMEMLTFLEPDEEQTLELMEEASDIRETLVHSLSRNLPLRSKNLVYNSIANFLSELEKQSCTLLLLIWQSLGFNMDNHPLQLSLNRTAFSKEQVLFELLEAYRLAHLEIGIPVPPGFHTLYICLGYVCLDPIMFLQYLQNGVFVPTKKFIAQLLVDADSSNEHVVFQIISNMEGTLAEYAFEHWQNPTVQHLQNCGRH